VIQSYRACEFSAAIRAKTSPAPPEVVVDHAIAVVAESRETNVKPDDEHEKRKKNEPGKWLMSHDQNKESAEDDACRDSESTLPPTLFRSGSPCPDPNPAGDSKRKPRDHEDGKVRLHRIACHTPNEKEISHARVWSQTH
jgi:hypothetical protein